MTFLWMFFVTAAIVQVSVLFTTIYLHRALCHRGLDLHPIAVNLMHLHLSLFTGVVPRHWVAVHRKHHHFADREGDPHSPYLLGLWHVFLGNYFYYRRETHNPATIRKYTPDYCPDLVDRLPLIRYGVLGGLGIFMWMFGWAWGLAAWGFHVAAYILLNSSINSFCHKVGYRNYDNPATNIRFVAWLTGGEGLHNNHHEYPTSPRFARNPGKQEFDPAWPVICLLERCGLARLKPQPMAKAA